MGRPQHTEIGDSHPRCGLHSGHTTRHHDADIRCVGFARSRSRIEGIRTRLKRGHDRNDSDSIANRQLGRTLRDLAGHLLRCYRAAGISDRAAQTVRTGARTAVGGTASTEISTQPTLSIQRTQYRTLAHRRQSFARSKRRDAARQYAALYLNLSTR